MVNISFGISVSGITEKECNALVDKLVNEEIIEEGHDDGDQRWQLDGVKYEEEHFNIHYITSDAGDGYYYVFHADGEDPEAGGRLMITFDWYHGDSRTRDRVSYKSRFDRFVDSQHNLLALRNEIQPLTEDEVAVGVIELR